MTMAVEVSVRFFFLPFLDCATKGGLGAKGAMKGFYGCWYGAGGPWAFGALGRILDTQVGTAEGAAGVGIRYRSSILSRAGTYFEISCLNMKRFY